MLEYYVEVKINRSLQTAWSKNIVWVKEVTKEYMFLLTSNLNIGNLYY